MANAHSNVFEFASGPSNDATPADRRRCPDFVVGTSHGHGTELCALLLSRLRIVSLIGLVPLVYFSIVRLIEPEQTTPEGFGTFGLIFMGALVALHVGITTLLWRRDCFSTCQLRKIETVMFVSVAGFFAFVQFCQMLCGHFVQWTEPGSVGKVFHLLMVASSLRWFFLIVLYGVLIPNTWKRCAAMSAVAVLLPLLIALTIGLSRPEQRPILLSPILSMAVILLSGFAIAIFGSHRIHWLHKQATEARQLGQYRLVRKIGAGGMGEVHLAEHLLLRRDCAVKLIRPNQDIDDVLLARFEREVRTMAKLTHWNTVDIFDYGRAQDGTFYYVMEYLPGINLEQMVRKNGPLPASRVVHFLRQTCHALREAHNLGFLHRDIKPSNVIACERGGVRDVVKLLDFGLVHSRERSGSPEQLTMHGTILGSPQYVSPEQARGRRDLQPSSDVYSVGAVAYYLLTGQPPFVRETVMELLIAHARDSVIAPREMRAAIPADLEKVVLRCLQKNPEDRFADVTELEEALNACECAGDWTEEEASRWWREREDREEPDAPEKSSVNEVATTTMESAMA